MTSSLDLIRGRQVVQTLTNKSGGAVIAGDVVIIDTANDEAFTTTTTAAYNATQVGIALESIASNATGRVLLQGYAPLVNVSASATRGYYLLTHTVAKQATSGASFATGAFGQVLKAGTTPSAYIFPPAIGSSAGITRTGSTTDLHLAIWDGSNADKIKDGGAIGGGDGWTAAAGTWTYSSADAPTYVISVNADMTTTISVGQRIKLTDTTVKYFIVTAVGVFGGGVTLITVYGGTDYTLSGGAITLPYYSTSKAPFGFPLSPAKWTVQVTDGTNRQQVSPTANTWYNLGTISITIPIGAWQVRYQTFLGVDRGASGSVDAYCTLSTANNSESDSQFTTAVWDTASTGEVVTVSRTKILALASKTVYYLNTRTTQTGMSDIYNFATPTPTIIDAVCAYL